MTPPRPSATGGKQLAAVATAAIPVVMLSSLAMAAPAHAQAGIQPHANHGTLNTADVLAAIQARTAQAKTSSIPAAVVASSVPTAVTANLHIGNAQSSKALLAKTQATVRYTVRAGDTVSAIAAKHAVSTSSVLTLNKLSGTSIIYPGQVLVVTAGSGVSSSTGAPAASSPAAVYTVKSGDTLGGIAAKHNISLNSIFSFNGLSGSSVIYPGQKIKVGGAAQSGSSQAASAKPAITSSTSQSYTVKSGDTLGGIAAKHNVSLGSIFSLNALSSNSVIYPGQKVKVGGTAQAGSAQAGSAQAGSAQAGSAQGGSGAAAKPAATSGRYTIKSGDTLSGIAARHGVSMAALVSANGISANATIYPGKTLSIPGLSASSSSITPISPGPGLTPDQKVPNTFLHYTYPDAVVADANKNKAALLAAPSPTRAQMKDIVARTATSMGVDPALALAFAQQESGFNHQSVSPANAIGTMQVIPDAGDWASGLVGRKLNLLDPQDNVTAGVAIIRALLRGAPTEDLAIAGYYQGQYSVSVHGMFPDTRNYVAGIKANRASFR